MKRFDITVSSVNVRPAGGRHVDISFYAQESELLELIDIADALSHYGIGRILNFIGEDEAIKHFEIED